MAVQDLIITLAGRLTPITISSRLYLSQQLARHGVVVSQIPKGCLQELADRAVALAKTVARLRGHDWRNGVTDFIDCEAASVAQLITGDKDFLGHTLADPEYRTQTIPILERYGVAFRKPD